MPLWAYCWTKGVELVHESWSPLFKKRTTKCKRAGLNDCSKGPPPLLIERCAYALNFPTVVLTWLFFVFLFFVCLFVAKQLLAKRFWNIFILSSFHSWIEQYVYHLCIPPKGILLHLINFSQVFLVFHMWNKSSISCIPHVEQVKYFLYSTCGTFVCHTYLLPCHPPPPPPQKKKKKKKKKTTQKQQQNQEKTRWDVQRGDYTRCCTIDTKVLLIYNGQQCKPH